MKLCLFRISCFTFLEKLTLEGKYTAKWLEIISSQTFRILVFIKYET